MSVHAFRVFLKKYKCCWTFLENASVFCWRLEHSTLIWFPTQTHTHWITLSPFRIIYCIKTCAPEASITLSYILHEAFLSASAHALFHVLRCYIGCSAKGWKRVALTAMILSRAESCSQYDLPACISLESNMELKESPACSLGKQSAIFPSNYTLFLFYLPLRQRMPDEGVFPQRPIPSVHFSSISLCDLIWTNGLFWYS